MNRKTQEKVSQSIIANQVASDFLHEIRHTPYNKQKVKNLLNQLNDEFERIEKAEFQKIDEVQEEATNVVYITTREVAKELSGFSILDFPDVINTLRALKQDRKSVVGIVNKILKT